MEPVVMILLVTLLILIVLGLSSSAVGLLPIDAKFQAPAKLVLIVIGIVLLVALILRLWP